MDILTMDPVRHDIAVFVGRTESYPFQVLQEDDSVFDLTGSILEFRAKWGNTEYVKRTDTPGSGFAITDAATGDFELTLFEAEQDDWPDGTLIRYRVDREVGAIIEPIFYGLLIITLWVDPYA